MTRMATGWELADVTIAKPGSTGQDASGSATAGGTVLLAVSDGAGTASHSELGAKQAVGCFLEEASVLASGVNSLDTAQNLLSSLWSSFDTSFGIWQARQPGSPGDYLCTLQAAVISFPWLLSISVGDGFTYIEGGGGGAVVVPPGHREGLYQNEVLFVQNRPKPTLLTIWDPGLRAVLVSTDGLEKFLDIRPQTQHGKPQPVCWGPSGNTLSDLTKLVAVGKSAHLSTVLEDERIMRRKNDDIGIAIAVR